MGTLRRLRLDILVVERGLTETRSRAQALILAGRVRVNNSIATKTGLQVNSDADVTVSERDHPFVGRGGLKLTHAFDQLGIDVRGRIALDIGASTGGFTHVLLCGGVQKVYAVDVGSFQLSDTVKSDPRVINLENTDARKLNNEIIVDPLDLVVCDVSFISLKKVLVPSMALIKTGGQLLCLFKPQFEIGPGKLKKTGVLNDATLRVQLLKEMEHWFLSMEGWKLEGSTESVLPGRNGNKEFFLLVEKL